ncbi:MAG: hypothetical protein AAF518_24190 [Spirochaetota bacterium]
MFHELTSWKKLREAADTGKLPDLIGQILKVCKTSSLEKRNESVLRSLHHALVANKGFITRYPETLFQCLFNTLTVKTEQNSDIIGLLTSWEEVGADKEYPWLRNLRSSKQDFYATYNAPSEPIYIQYTSEDSIYLELSDGKAGRINWETGELEKSYFLQSPNESALEYLEFDTPPKDNTIFLRNKETNQILFEISWPEVGSCSNGVFSSDHSHFALWGWVEEYEGLVFIFQRNLSGEFIPAATIETARRVREFCFSGNTQTIAIVMDGEIEIYLREGVAGSPYQYQQTLDGFVYTPKYVALSYNGNYIAIQDEANLIYQIERSTFSRSMLSQQTPLKYGHVAFSQTGNTLYCQPCVYDGKTGKMQLVLNDYMPEYLEGGPPENSHFVDDEKIIDVSGGSTRAFALPNGKLLWKEATRYAQWDYIAFDPGGSSYIAFTHKGAQLYDMRTGKVLTHLKLSTPTAAALNEGASLLAFAEDTNDIHVWDLTSQKEILLLEGHIQQITGMYFSANSKYLVSAAENEDLRLWDIHSGKCITTREPGHTAYILQKYRYKEKRPDNLTPRKEKVRIWKPIPTALHELESWHGVHMGFALSRYIAKQEGKELQILDRNENRIIARCLVDSTDTPVPHPGGKIWASLTYHMKLEGIE